MMPHSDAVTQKMERYLKELRAGLRELPEGEAREIVEEIRSHLRDCLEKDGEQTLQGVVATLERLGPARQLAAQYRVETLARRARRSGSPWLALRTIARWAGLSVKGAWVLLVSLVGYGLAAALMICAVAKPFNPSRVGLWRLGDPDASWSLHLGFGAAPEGTEVLGWWIVPLGLLLGAGLCFLTLRFGLYSLGKFRRQLPTLES